MTFRNELSVEHEGRLGDTLPADAMPLERFLSVTEERSDMATTLSLLFDRPGWWDEAACLGSGPALWFTGRGESQKEARQVCEGCPSRVPCGEAGLSEYHGTWGGMSERARREERVARFADSERPCPRCGVLVAQVGKAWRARMCEACRKLAHAESAKRSKGAA